jgi:hypothetical protein
VTLKGDVIHFEFVSKPKDKQGEGAQQGGDGGKNYANASGGSARPPASRPAPAAPKNNFDDFDDDVGF